MDLSSMVPVLIGAGVGACVTWLAAWLYYKKAGNQLTKETAELRRLTILVLRGLETADLVTLNRDASGKIIGFIIKASAKAIGVGSASAKAQVLRPESETHGTTETGDATK